MGFSSIPFLHEIHFFRISFQVLSLVGGKRIPSCEFSMLNLNVKEPQTITMSHQPHAFRTLFEQLQ